LISPEKLPTLRGEKKMAQQVNEGDGGIAPSPFTGGQCPRALFLSFGMDKQHTRRCEIKGKEVSAGYEDNDHHRVEQTTFNLDY
jgi:hypothetical protein